MKTARVNGVPKYERVKRQLIREIESGTRTSGEPFPSERELLLQFGVSRPTLVRSLQELVREGYLVRKQGKGTFVASRQPNGGAEDAKSDFVVFLSRHVAGLTGAGREVQLRILRGIQDAFGNAYDVSGVRQVASGALDNDTRRFLDHRPNGAALVIEPSFCPALPHYLIEHGWAVWSVNEPCSGINCVRIDQEHAGYLATQYLIDQGSRRIALLNGPADAYWGFGARFRGYARALVDAGISVDAGLVLEDAHAIDSEAGRAMMRRLLESGAHPDGIVGASDSKAMGAMACAVERGVRIPDELAFVSIDNTLASQADHPLPAVAMPFEEMGFQAAWQARMASVARGASYAGAQTELILRPMLVER